MLNNLGAILTEAAKQMLFSISQWSNRVLGGMKIEGNYWIILDIVIVAFIIYWFLSKILESKAVRILYGIIILVSLLVVGHFLNLLTLNWLLKYLSLMLVVAIPIIFQPEIRSALDKLGRAGFSGRPRFSRKDLEELIQALETLAQHKIGAIIVLERKIPLKEYAKTGHLLHADISRELILSIFETHSPLHDGAIIISGGKVIAAGCMLPMPQEKESLGARHRSARYLTTHTDALAVIVSGERGSISVAFEGEMESGVSLKQVRYALEKIFSLE